jgi:hypothetical protein
MRRSNGIDFVDTAKQQLAQKSRTPNYFNFKDDPPESVIVSSGGYYVRLHPADPGSIPFIVAPVLCCSSHGQGTLFLPFCRPPVLFCSSHGQGSLFLPICLAPVLFCSSHGQGTLFLPFCLVPLLFCSDPGHGTLFLP